MVDLSRQIIVFLHSDTKAKLHNYSNNSNMPSPRNDLSNDVTVTQQSLDDRGLAVKTSDDAAAAAAKKLETGGVSDAVDDDDDAKYLCGLGPFKPSCLQRLNNPIGALCFLCWYAFVQGQGRLNIH